MPDYYSSADPNAFVAFGMQSALGTPQTTAGKLRFAKYLDGTNAEGALEVVDLREGGDGLDYGYSYKKSQKAQGQLVINGRPEIAGQLLAALPGGATWDGATANPAAHTFHTGHASFPLMTMFVQHPGSSLPQMLSDLLFTGITIEGGAGEPWKFTLPFIAIQHGASYAALTPTYAGEEPLLFQHSPTYVIDGTGDTDLTGFRIEHTLSVEELQAQAVTLDAIAVQNRDTNVEITRRYTDPALWKKIYMGAGVTPTTSVATGSFRGAALYGTGTTLRSLDLNTPLLSYRGNALTELSPDGRTVIETISAKALKGATHALIAVLKNAHASAYAS